MTCNRYSCFTKVDNFDLKFKKAQSGYNEIKTDIKPSELTKVLLTDNESFGARFKQKASEYYRLKQKTENALLKKKDDNNVESDDFPIDSQYRDNYFKRLPGTAEGFTMPKLTAEQLKEINDRLAAAIRSQIMNDLGGAINKVVKDINVGKIKIKLENGLK